MTNWPHPRNARPHPLGRILPSGDGGADGAGGAQGGRGGAGGDGAGTDSAALLQGLAAQQQSMAQQQLQQQQFLQELLQQVQQQGGTLASVLAMQSGGAQQAAVPNTGNELFDSLDILGRIIAAADAARRQHLQRLLSRTLAALQRQAVASGLQVSGLLVQLVFAMLEEHPEQQDAVVVAQACQQAQATGVATAPAAGGSNGAGPSRQRGVPRRGDVCHKCGREGHWSRYCRARNE